MKERPILMATDSVKAILDGTKTMTRRVIKPCSTATVIGKDSKVEQPDWVFTLAKCPYGQVGDRLWVRETFCESTAIVGRVLYKAEGVIIAPSWKWKPSIFMTRWASRLTLEITALRVERLQEITPEDCIAEGISPDYTVRVGLPVLFEKLWNKLNAKRGYGWETNPFVWVLSFKQV